jgi:hypothetical protein
MSTSGGSTESGGSGDTGGSDGGTTQNTGGTTGGGVSDGGSSTMTGGKSTSGGAGGTANTGGKGGSTAGGVTGGSITGGSGQAGKAATGGVGGGSLSDVPATNLGGTITVSGSSEKFDGKDWIRVTKARLYIDPNATDPSLKKGQWVALVENIGTDILCNSQVAPTFYDAQGGVVATVFAEKTYSPVYDRPNVGRPIYCLAPGELGAVQGVRTDDGPALDLSKVTQMKYTAVGVVAKDAFRKDWATLSNDTVASEGGGQVLKGRLTNGAQTLGWWRIHAFPKDSSGAPLGVRDVADTRAALAPGTTWDFATDPFTGAVAGFYVFIEHGNPS